MRLLLVRSIPLSRDTRAAWRAAGAKFMRRNREMSTLTRLPFDVILNLGDSSFEVMDDLPEKWWNTGEAIRMFRSPTDMRENFGDLIPPRPEPDSTTWWHKTYGRGGSGNLFFNDMAFRDVRTDLDGDFQEHIVGTEYRITTVGDRIVQQHKRIGDDTERTYEWLSAESMPNGIRPLVKKALDRIPGHNVIAWDTILASKKAYLLEGNASPGMNEATAHRVIREISAYRGEINA